MSLSQMQVFNEYVMPATIETLDQMLVAFNAASRGAILLSPDGFTGDFLQESFFQTLAAAQRRVDRYAANGAGATCGDEPGALAVVHLLVTHEDPQT